MKWAASRLGCLYHTPVVWGLETNAIRRVQEKIRILRDQLETGLACKIFDIAPIMSWLIRWAAEILSKYAPGDDGKTPYERIRNEACAVPNAIYLGRL